MSNYDILTFGALEIEAYTGMETVTNLFQTKHFEEQTVTKVRALPLSHYELESACFSCFLVVLSAWIFGSGSAGISTLFSISNNK